MAKKKVVEAPVVEPVIQQKLRGIAASKRAPLLRGEEAKMFYQVLKDLGIKVAIDQSIFMPQYGEGKKPFGRFLICKEFRVVIDLTE